MGKYANTCAKMHVKIDNPPRTGRAGSIIASNDPVDCGNEPIKDAPFYTRIKLVTGNHQMMGGFPSNVKKEVYKYADGHEGGPYPKYHHAADNVMLFIGTDPNNLNDLGAHVEFHVGEGADEEVFEFDEPTHIFIPKGVRHGPLYVTKFRRNLFVIELHTAPNRRETKTTQDVGYVADDKKLLEVIGGFSSDLLHGHYPEGKF